MRGQRLSLRAFVALALALAVGMAAAISPFASGAPDGLEKVAERKAFLDEGTLTGVQEEAPIAGYTFPGIGDRRLATGMAGFAGTLGVFALGSGLALALGRRRRVGSDAQARSSVAT